MDALALAFSAAITPTGLTLILAGCLIAMLMGILPGLSGTEALIILLPFTFQLNLSESMLLLSSAYAGSYVGGALTSIVFGIPGTSTSMATVFDGHPLHRQGRTAYAVTVASVASAAGGILSLVVVVLLMSVIEPLSLLFGPAEWFAFVVFGFVALALSNDARFVRVLISACLGLLLGSVGLSIVTATPRFTFGLPELWGGIPVVAAFIGVYPLTEAVYMALDRSGPPSTEAGTGSAARYLKEMGHAVRDVARHPGTVIATSGLGWVVGVIPGVGATLANMLGYMLARGIAKDQSRFGKGDVRGLIGAETANNASVGGALVPALALGIPGSLNTAILLGIFVMNGIQPGTNIFRDNLDVTWLILIAVAASTVIASAVIILGGAWLISMIAHVRPRIIPPVIVFVASIAALMSQGNSFDLVVAAVMTVVGVAMKAYGFSRIALVIALILGPLVESSFYQTLGIGRGSYLVFFQSTVSMIIWFVIAVCLGSHFFRLWRRQ
jgi:putative tricarboxylic transport membrane protein